MQNKDIKQLDQLETKATCSCGLMQNKDIKQLGEETPTNSPCCGLMQNKDIKQRIEICELRPRVVV